MPRDGTAIADCRLKQNASWLMEAIMFGKIDKHHNNAISAATDELQDDQLDKVTGGLVVVSIIEILVGLLIPKVDPPPPSK
jgi:hypothetical protein